MPEWNIMKTEKINMETTDQNLENILGKNYEIVMSEKPDPKTGITGMIYEFRRKLDANETEESPYLDGTSCVSVEFFYKLTPPLFQEGEEGGIERFGTDGLSTQEIQEHKALYGNASYKIKYNASKIGYILACTDYDKKVTSYAKRVLEGTLAKFNALSANKIPHEVNLFLMGPNTTEQIKPFSRTAATRDINHALKKHRAHTAR